MIDEICVVGYPSLCGGADTELLDQIKLWSKLGIKTHIIPTKHDKNKIDLSNYNVVIHEVMEFEKCQGLHTISFCNPAFLSFSSTIKKYARSTTWINCMTFNWKTELEAHKRGDIDFFLYQTKHQYNNLAGNLLNVNKNYTAYQFVPYFDDSRFPYKDPHNRDYSILRYGRISRADINKYSKDQFKIYASCKSKKFGNILGWKNEFRKKFDAIHLSKSNCIFYYENQIRQQELYSRSNMICMSTNTFENLPRVGFEAMSSGSVLVVDNRGGWKLQVESGKTGFLCNNESEFIEAMDYLNNNPELFKEFARKAREKLEADFSFKKSASSWLTFLEGIDKIK